MAEPFKNLLNRDIIEGMAAHFNTHYSNFNKTAFINDATRDLDSLELKERTDRITETMITYLPDSFEQAADIMLRSLGSLLGDNVSSGTVDSKGIAGWAITPLAHYVGIMGLDNFSLSMKLFKEMTKRASSEFGIRFFLIRYPKETTELLKKWAHDSNQHVRRLVSEGTRPRLPWAMRLPVFIEDPSPVIALLEMLKDDKSEYVRRSVANNLNDIAKDHPETVAEIAYQWMVNASSERQRLIRHGCRTLVKKGHKRTLEILGYSAPEIHKTNLDLLTPEVVFGDTLEFRLSITSNSSNNQALMIDYIIHHQKSNGKTSPNVFKWRVANLAKRKTLEIVKKHKIKPITTRTYYSGIHGIEVIINGVSMGRCDFNLSI